MRAIIISLLALTLLLTSLVHAEPNLVAWYEFEEGFGSDTFDSSGNENHGIIHGDPCWVSGRVGYYALDFDGDGDYINVDSWFKLETHTTSLWIKPNNLHNGKIIQPIKGTSRSFGYIALTSQGKISHLVRSYTSLGISKISASTDSVIEAGRWYHIVSIMGSDGNRIYVNGVEQTLSYTFGSASSTESWACIYKGNGPDNLNIGTCIYDSVGHDYFYGKIDDIRIYDRALSSTEVLNLYDPAIACNPYPPDGQQCIEPNVVLTWSPGEWASDINGHDVYLGTNFDDVNDANTKITLDVYKGRQDANFYDPCGLEWGRIYYWRIDEVNDSNIDSPWKGRVWGFEIGYPYIELSANYFNFLAEEINGPNPPPQTLSISNSCSGILNWQITEDCNWLTAEPNSGSSKGEINDVNISIDIAGLALGVYDCELMISDPCAENSPQAVAVHLVVYGPIIELSENEFEFLAAKGGPNPEEQILNIRNSGVGTLNWTITYDCNWLQIIPTFGSSTGDSNDVILCVDTMGLDVDTYDCELMISDPCAENSPQAVAVNLVVCEPMIELSANYFNFFTEEVNGPNPPAQTLSISNYCSGTLNWQITEDCDWLTVEPNSGSSTVEPNDVTISVDITGFSIGVYDCILTVSDPCAANNPQTVLIQLAVKECYAGMPDYDQWVAVGRPECWCYPRQCHGDADGLWQGSRGVRRYVDTDDLDIMVAGWQIKEPPKGSGILDLHVYGVPVACADFAHNVQGSAKTGYIRIDTDDLDLMSAYWQVKELPKGSGTPADCMPGNRTPY